MGNVETIEDQMKNMQDKRTFIKEVVKHQTIEETIVISDEEFDSAPRVDRGKSTKSVQDISFRPATASTPEKTEVDFPTTSSTRSVPTSETPPVIDLTQECYNMKRTPAKVPFIINKVPYIIPEVAYGLTIIPSNVTTLDSKQVNIADLAKPSVEVSIEKIKSIFKLGSEGKSTEKQKIYPWKHNPLLFQKETISEPAIEIKAEEKGAIKNSLKVSMKGRTSAEIVEIPSDTRKTNDSPAAKQSNEALAVKPELSNEQLLVNLTESYSKLTNLGEYCTKQMPKYIKVILKAFTDADKEYQESEELQKFLLKTIRRLEKNPNSAKVGLVKLLQFMNSKGNDLTIKPAASLETTRSLKSNQECLCLKPKKEAGNEILISKTSNVKTNAQRIDKPKEARRLPVSSTCTIKEKMN